MSADPTDFSSFEEAALQRQNGPRTFIRFEKKTDTIDPVKTAEAGYPVHVETHIAFKRNPGSRDEFAQKIDAKFLAEHGAAYEKWLATQEQPLDGLALELWPPIPKTLVEDWKHFGVRTVQALANLSDTACQKMGMGMIEWRKRAQAWLADAHDNAASQRLVAENEQLKREIERLSTQVADLAARHDPVAVPVPAPVFAPNLDMAALAEMVAARMQTQPAKPASRKLAKLAKEAAQ